MQKNTIQNGFALMPVLPCLVSLRPGLAAEIPDRILTMAVEVRSLSALEVDRQYPVKLREVVTFYDEALYARFVQDETADIYGPADDHHHVRSLDYVRHE
jgi:hypothetical protein